MVRVGMYVCMHACMHACMHVCMHVCMYVYVNVCVCVCVCICMCICICMFISMYMGNQSAPKGSSYPCSIYLVPAGFLILLLWVLDIYGSARYLAFWDRLIQSAWSYVQTLNTKPKSSEQRCKPESSDSLRQVNPV